MPGVQRVPVTVKVCICPRVAVSGETPPFIGFIRSIGSIGSIVEKERTNRTG